MAGLRVFTFALFFCMLSLIYGVWLELLPICAALILGYLIAKQILQIQFTNYALLIIGAGTAFLIFLLGHSITWLFDFLQIKFVWHSFEIWIVLITFTYSLVSSLIIGIWPYFVFVEGLSGILFLAFGLEAIRDLNLGVSKFVYEGAKFFGIQDLLFVAVLGAIFTIIFAFAVIVGHKRNLGKLSVVLWSVLVLILSLALASYIASYFSKKSALTPMGVGFNDSESQTPLSFDSFVGTSQHATALVKLNRTYYDVRTAPLVYFREGALSKFNGRELIRSEYDKDVPTKPPNIIQEFKNNLGSAPRVDVKQDVFLLINHSTPFSLDLPFRFVPFPNPNPEKFVGGSFSVYSLAPNFDSNFLNDISLGSPEWSVNELKHYTEVHHDPRYGNLAREIVDGHSDPIRQIHLLIEHINKNYIYTVKPNHKVKPSDDPVAPFLFGDRRGYCVHIAHALVYMFRALGIPSRIGIGYASDLSQSRDGYMLLRMSDRHAWPEIYFSKVGWVIFDARPEQVESHVESPVDEKLLKDLIEEVEKENDEYNLDKPNQRNLAKYLYWLLPTIFVSVLIATFLIAKCYLWFGYKIFKNRKYLAVSILSRLYDSGYRRKNTETLEEFLSKIKFSDNFEREILENFFGPESLEEAKTPRLGGLTAFLSGRSIFQYFMVRRW
ncbi:MAG: transglutaminase domain-containing protein [Deltaproteobacteria bacterium]|nr:transglutaminase domain-containing protein [Deltaproteobacteria bacterium]